MFNARSMSNLSTFKFKYWDPLGTVKSLVEGWIPSNCQSEKDFESSLYEHLCNSLPGVVITPQYAYGRARTDLVIGNKVAIEIKKDLLDTSEFQRLIGQIFQFKDWGGYFLVLLVGETDRNLRDELQKQITDNFSGGLYLSSQRVSLVEKSWPT